MMYVQGVCVLSMRVSDSHHGVVQHIQLSLGPKGNEILFRLFDHDALSKDDPMGAALLTIPTPSVRQVVFT